MPASKELHDALDAFADKKAAADVAVNDANALDTALAKARDDANAGHSKAGQAAADLLVAENAFIDQLKAFAGEVTPPAPPATDSTVAASGSAADAGVTASASDSAAA